MVTLSYVSEMIEMRRFRVTMFRKTVATTYTRYLVNLMFSSGFSPYTYW